MIGFRLGDAYFAAFDKYYQATQDERSYKMCNYIRYGTNDPKEIMLLRYGFEFEDFEWIKKHVVQIDEEEIVFQNTAEMSDEQREKVKKYMWK